MKKTLIALAALAATASFAQSSVTISGLWDLGINQTDFKGNKVTTTGAANGSATSTIIFSGNEDLGGGLNAHFRYELNPDLGNTVGRTAGTPATGTTSNVTSSLGNGYSFLGLSGGFGRVELGTLNYATLSAQNLGNGGFSTAIGSGYRVSSFDAVRAQNSVSYQTPTFNGFSARLQLSTKNDKQSNTSIAAVGNEVNQINGRDGAQELSLAYAMGSLNVRYARLQTKQYAIVSDPGNTLVTPRGTGQEFKLDTFAASYVFGDATIAGFYQKASSDNLNAIGGSTRVARLVDFDRKTTGIAGSYKLNTSTTLMANYQRVKVGDETNAGNDNQTTNVMGLGVDYALSKRSTIYARYERDADKAGVRTITGYTAATGNTTYTAAAVGIRHTF